MLKREVAHHLAVDYSTVALGGHQDDVAIICVLPKRVVTMQERCYWRYEAILLGSACCLGI
uniref:Uncharacterized protein n=1 Tax=Setaria viridis TaxID=4556 RepID=A0A4U6VXU5_SETVI|nr:hypothetical protein SEVIR_2G300500v2 [Setaria viridis]